MAAARATPRRRLHEPRTETPRAARRRRAGTAAIVVTALLAVVLLLAGSPAGAFVSGLVAGSAALARYFHTIATRPIRDD
jgi:hypothetical protein